MNQSKDGKNPIEARKKAVPKRSTATKVLKNASNPNNKFAPKTIDQKFVLKAEIAIRMKRGQSRNRIFETMNKDGIKISKNSVYSYAEELRSEWIESKNESYDSHVSLQLARLDAMEEKCWEMMDDSSKEMIKKSLEYQFKVDDPEASEGNPDIGTESGTSDEKQDHRIENNTIGSKSEASDENPKVKKSSGKKIEAERKLISEKIEFVQRYGDIEVMKMIERLWVRRNEILGIQMQTTYNIQNNFTNNGIVQNENKPVSSKFFGNFIIEADVREGLEIKTQ